MNEAHPSGMAGEPDHILQQTKAAERRAKAIADIREGLARWQLWWLLGINDIRQRYRRSRMGQLWITVSMAAFIGAIGFVYSILFRMDAREYIPYLTVNFIVWTLISGTVNDACLAFTQAENYLRQERVPKTALIMRVILRNLLILAHNCFLIPVVMLIFHVSLSWTIFLAAAGLAILLFNLLLGSFFLAVVCTRFRDMPQIVAALVQIAFFISPIMWHRGQITQSFPAVIDYNPFAHHLIIVTEPVLGHVPGADRYLACLATTVILALVALPFFARYRERIVYWL